MVDLVSDDSLTTSSSSSGSEGGSGGAGHEMDGEDGESSTSASAQQAQGVAGGSWAHLTAARRAELLRRGGEATRQLAALRKEFGNRQRLVSGCCASRPGVALGWLRASLHWLFSFSPWKGSRSSLDRLHIHDLEFLSSLPGPCLQLLRVLSTKAAEAGSHADELRQLLGALDFSRWFERSMA